MNQNNEYKLVEKPALEDFSSLGYEVYDANEVGEEDETPDVRENLKNVILENRLREAIKRINPWINDNNLDKAVWEIKNPRGKGPMQINKKVHEMLVRHISLPQDLGSGKKKQTVKFIDFENPENNDFIVMNQYKVSGDREIIKPDLVVFVNGLPLGVIECKSPTITEPQEEAFKQLKRYQNLREREEGAEGAEKLFWYNQFTIASWASKALMGTYGTPAEQYKEWKEIYPEKDLKEVFDKDKINSQDRTVYSLFKKEKLLEMIKYFTVFQNKGEGPVKMVARYQQYRGVKKSLERIKNNGEKENKGGVIWHTQGSGKSLTMLFLSMKLRDIKNNPTILIVTDRITLDKQIKDTFEQCGYPNPKRAGGIEDLKEKLSGPSGQTITTLIHKFQPEGEKEIHEVLTEDEDIYVMVDEAHRTQYKDLANNMRTALPNASYFAFTGTPIEKKKRNTKSTFGNYIDTYTIDQSVEDGATVQIYYQGRLADIHLENQDDIDEVFDRVFTDKSKKEKKEIKKRYAREKYLAQSPKRIKKVCLDIIKHYEEKIDPPFKGMVVTESKKAAVMYKKYLDELNAPESKVIISEGHNDPKEIKEHTPSDSEKDHIKARFKDPNDDLKFVIVCDMLLTGFDAPVAQVMYLDKSLKEHTLLQAIARVNRPYHDKNYGLIVDYYGISDNLDDALAMFTKEEVEPAMKNLEDEKPKLEAAHRKAISFFDDLDDTEECIEKLEKKDKRIEFNKAFKRFSKEMDIVLPNPIANPYKKDLKKLGNIYARAKNRYRDESMNLTGCGEKVRKLIEENVSSKGISIINENPVSILDSKEFDKRVEKLESSKAKRSEMRNAIQHEISVKYKEDPEFYKSLRKKLQELIENYKEKRIKEKELLSNYKEIVSAIRSRQAKAQEEGFENTAQLALYDTLERGFNDKDGGGMSIGEPEAKTDFGKEKKKQMAKNIYSIIENNKKIDWKSKVKVKKEIRKKIKLYLLDKFNNISKEQLDSLTTNLIKLAQVHF